jgi:hypothetical protein
MIILLNVNVELILLIFFVDLIHKIQNSFYQYNIITTYMLNTVAIWINCFLSILSIDILVLLYFQKFFLIGMTLQNLKLLKKILYI